MLHIIVDGWNAIHSSSQLKKLLDSSPEAARAALLEKLAPVHDFGGSRLTIVYDGAGDEIQIERPNEILTLSEVFTPSFMTADELIEKLCASSKNASAITVVSRDNMLKLTASSFGALAISPEEIFDAASAKISEISAHAKNENRKSSRQWRRQKASPFDALDALFSEIQDSVSKEPTLISKRLKKRLNKKAEK